MSLFERFFDIFSINSSAVLYFLASAISGSSIIGNAFSTVLVEGAVLAPAGALPFGLLTGLGFTLSVCH